MLAVELPAGQFLNLHQKTVADVAECRLIVGIGLENLIGLRQPGLNDLGVSACIRPEALRINVPELCVNRSRLAEKFFDSVRLCAPLRFCPDPSVVEDPRPVAGDGAGVAPLPRCVKDGEEKPFWAPDRNRVANDAGRLAIPLGRPGLRISVPVKVNVVEDDGLDAGIVEVAFEAGADFGQIILVNHFVGFEIKGPVASAVEESD